MRVPFDKLAQEYDRWYEKPFGRSAFELETRCLRKLIENSDDSLEIGVGTGRFAQALGIKFGLDPSLSMLRIAKSRGITCLQGVGEALPFRNSSLELILIVVSICFVKDPFGVIRDSKRVLKKEGKLILGLIPQESLWADFYKEKAKKGHPIYKHATFYPLEEVKGMLTSAGFKLGSIKSTLIEEPQDVIPVNNKEITDGFDTLAGFTCIEAIS